jgi:protein-L-isoaspartate(D-aspartate) O-methyltransferase
MMRTLDDTTLREQMVREQLEARGIVDGRVLAAMRRVPRERFLSPAQVPHAYDDCPLPIGRGQTVSQPFIVALMTEALELRPTDRVLEVGAGCGYQSAVLACVAGEVCALERDPALAEEARLTLSGLGFHQVEVRCGDGYEGWPAPGPRFDAILIACAPLEPPPRLLAQLAPGGRMVLPLGEEWGVQELVLLKRRADGALGRTKLGSVRFVPMVRGAG